MHVESRWGVWLAGLRIGLRAMRHEPILALKHLILPVGYWRTAEFAYVLSQLRMPSGAKVLDLGSPKDLAALLARYRRMEVVAVDILPEAIDRSERLAAAQGLSGRGPGLVYSEVQDGRALPYPNNSFDAAFSVSVLEHIPENGDTEALTELVRVVRPGGLIVLTTPFDKIYRETMVDGPVYERNQVNGQPVFYQRHYDENSMQARLLDVRDIELLDARFFAEPYLPVERWLEENKWLQVVCAPVEPLLSILFLQQLAPGAEGRMAAFLTLRKKPGRMWDGQP